MNIHAPVAVIAAMQPELDFLQQQLHDAEHLALGSVQVHRGRLADTPVVLALSGIGKVNAAMTAAMLIERFHPCALINTGSAGGLGHGLRVGDVVIGAQSAHHDVDVRAFGYVLGQVPQLPARYDADAMLMQKAEQAAAAACSGVTVRRGLIVSGDQFVHERARIAAIKADFADVQAVEMEAAAIAQVCFQQKVPFVVIRAISDNGDEQATVSFDEFLHSAGRQSARMVQAIIAAKLG